MLKSILLKPQLVFCILFLSYSINAQIVQLDPKFNPYDDGLLGDGFDGTVRTLALQLDGKLLVGGEFLNYNGSKTAYFCRLELDGSKDLNFHLGTAFNGKVYAAVVQSDMKIIVAGSFTSFDGNSVGKIVRLNSDGTIDNTFDATIGVSSGTIYGLALQSDGKLIVTGSFTKYNNLVANRIVRLQTNGQIDLGFDSTIGATGTIDDVAISPAGKILISGTFSAYNANYNYTKIALLNADGSLDNTFSIGSGFDDAVDAIAFQPDGKILVGGNFLNYNGNTQNRIVRLLTNGTMDASFLSNTGFSNGAVQSILVSNSGQILVGGSFSDKYNSSDVNRLILLNANGTVDANFDIGTGPSSATIYTLCESADSFFTGGSFSFFDDLKQGKLAKISKIGELDSGFLTAGVGFDKAVDKVISLDDGSFLAFGSFTQFNGKSINRIVKLTAKGELDTTFNPNQLGANSTVKEVLVQPDGKLLVAGNFTSYNGIPVKRLVRLLENGSIDSSFNVGSGFNYMVYSIVLQTDGKIIAAGSFTTYKGASVKKVIRLLNDGSLDNSFSIGTNPNDIPNLLTLQADAKLIVSGDFTTFNGIAAKKIVRLNSDGSVDSGFNTGNGFDAKIYSVTLQKDGKILVGGSFNLVNGISNKKITRLNSNGTIDVSFNSGSGFSGGIVRTIQVQSNGRILVGGSFSGNYNGNTVKRMLRLMSNGSYDSSFSVLLNGQLNSISFVPDKGAVIGGNFNSVSGVSKHRIALLIFCQDGTIWDGNTWSNGIPTQEKSAIFNANYEILNDTKVCSCVVNAGAVVTVKNGATLETSQNYSGLGSLVFEDKTSLYQADEEVVNTGIIQYKRKTTPVRKQDYTYWSSPVANQKLSLLSPNSPTDRFFTFDSARNDWFKESFSNGMVLGKGYIFQPPQSFSETIPAIFEIVFSGIPNNGQIEIPVIKTKSPILLGNPYPSALNADEFILENQNLIQGSLYFWTHNTAIAKGQYTSDDYAVYNIFGGVGNAAKNSGVNNTRPNGKIAAGQSFFTLGVNLQAGNVVFKNKMRLKGENSLFYKTAKTLKTAEIANFEKHRIWLNLSNDEGMFKQILVGYATGATNGKDLLLDGISLDANEWLDFYSLNNGDKNSIQARALPFDAKDAIALGFRAKKEGSYSLNLEDFDGIFAQQNLYLEDKQEAKIHDLKQGNYTFSTGKGSFDNRFVLQFEKPTITPEKVISKVNFSITSNQIIVNTNVGLINELYIYSIDGKLLYKSTNLSTKTQKIDSIQWKSRVLIVKTILDSGEVFISKELY